MDADMEVLLKKNLNCVDTLHLIIKLQRKCDAH